MEFPMIPQFKLKRGGGEKKQPFWGLSVFSPSSKLGTPTPSSNRTTDITKLIKFGSNHPWLCNNVFACGSAWFIVVILTTRLITPCEHWFQKSHVLIMLHNNVTRFLKNRLLGGKRLRDEEVAWGNLPLELWGEIGKRLTSRLDILCFRSVCKKWRSSLPFPRFPVLVPPPPSCDPELRNSSYFIAETNLYSTNKNGTGIVWFEEVGQGHMLRCPYGVPFDVMYRQSAVSSTTVIPRRLHSQLSFVTKLHRLRMTLPRFDSHNKRIEGQWDLKTNNTYAKNMVLLSSNADGVNPSYARASDLIVVAHLSWGRMRGRLALLRLGGSPENWEWDTEFCSRVFEDITTYKGQLCTVDHSGRLLLMDTNSLEMTELCPPSSSVRHMRTKFLFEVYGDLYLYNLSGRIGHPMEMFKLSLQLRKWVKFEDLSGQVTYFMSAFYLMYH